ncbi:MAG TPA: hypothetical protein VH253_13075 [Phycisphaerae bacterium]|nr:hypothetical protein [Phycisphaerae bacterium]
MGILSIWRSLWQPAPGQRADAAAPTGRMSRLLLEARAAFNTVRAHAPAVGGDDAELLRRYGQIVWGVVIEVCNGAPPGFVAVVVLYSLEDVFTEDVAGLVEIGRWVKGLKTTGQVDPRSAAVAAMVRCEWANGQCLSLPMDLVSGREIYVATAAWRRSGLPSHRLANVVLPVVVLPEATPAVGVLPVSCWPGEFAGEWIASTAPEATGVERRVEPRLETTWTAEEVLARYRANPISVTSAAATLIRAQLQARQLGPAACTSVRLVADGFATDFLDRPTGGMELCRNAATQGLLIAVLARREELVRLTGVTIDASGNHFIFRRDA